MTMRCTDSAGQSRTLNKTCYVVYLRQMAVSVKLGSFPSAIMATAMLALAWKFLIAHFFVQQVTLVVPVVTVT